MWVAVAAAAAAIAAALIGASTLRGGESSTKPRPAAVRTTLLAGIPQQEMTLGLPNAPVTLVEFADLQCPYCGQFSRDAMPSLIRDYVRTGRVRVVFAGLEFVGVDSDRALRAVIAAGRQQRGWDMLDALYQSQGAENTGWVTESLLRDLASKIPNLDVERMLREASGSAVDAQIARDRAFASRAGVSGTPTFLVGRRGGALRSVHLTSLTADALTPSLDALLHP